MKIYVIDEYAWGNNPRILSHEVVKETACFYICVPRTRRAGTVRIPKGKAHLSWAEAKAELVAQAERSVENAKCRLAEKEKELDCAMSQVNPEAILSSSTALLLALQGPSCSNS